MSEELRAQINAGIALLGLNKTSFAKAIKASNSKVSKALSGDTKSPEVLNDLKAALENRGIIFTKAGIERTTNFETVITGESCYLELLSQIMIDQNVDELLIMFASDKVSPPAVNDCYRFLRSRDVCMRQLIAEGDTYIMGALEEYRTIPEKYFTNIVTLVYGNSVAQVSGDEKRIVIYTDAKLAAREKKIFNYFWDRGGKPETSTADEKF